MTTSKLASLAHPLGKLLELPAHEAARLVLGQAREAQGVELEGPDQGILICGRAGHQSLPHGVARDFVPGEAVRVAADGTDQHAPVLGGAVLKHGLQHEVAEGVPQQCRRVPQGLLGQDLSLARGAVLQEPLQHPALHLVLRRLDDAASEGVNHELDLLREQVHDELLHHVVAMRRQRHLPDVANHGLHQQSLALRARAIHLDGLLKQARTTLGRSKHRSALRQALEVRSCRGNAGDESETNLVHSDLRRVVELVARREFPLHPLANREHRHREF
mmetsp:Transcript_69629/g.181098  ORF Transcript_69629/g.181098 Transcript_69629/m.181098 type:complete len:275 (+) Transcript_69629:308-1132(+)